jgi:CubicO group peptidase (beta-lactamase class C family)
MAVDLLGRVVGLRSARLADFLDEGGSAAEDARYGLLGSRQDPRLAQPLAVDLASASREGHRRLHEPKNDSRRWRGLDRGGLSALRRCCSTAGSRWHAGADTISALLVNLYEPVRLAEDIAVLDHLSKGRVSYTFGLGFALRPVGGIAGVPGSAGEFMWAGYAGTYFWVDPKEDLTAVYMSQAPSPIRAYYRKLVKQLVYGALTD